MSFLLPNPFTTLLSYPMPFFLKKTQMIEE
jgi:hypothetical protein